MNLQSLIYVAFSKQKFFSLFLIIKVGEEEIKQYNSEVCFINVPNMLIK